MSPSGATSNIDRDELRLEMETQTNGVENIIAVHDYIVANTPVGPPASAPFIRSASPGPAVVASDAGLESEQRVVPQKASRKSSSNAGKRTQEIESSSKIKRRR